MQAATVGRLTQSADTAQAVSTLTGAQSGGSGSSCSVQSLGTTANPARWQDNPEWSADLEYVWRNRTADARASLEQRARRFRKWAQQCEVIGETPALRVELLKSAEWCEHRARALAMARVDVVATCRTRWRTVACGCARVELQVGCDNPTLCEWCRRRHWRKWRHRITRSMKDHVKEARGEWSRSPGRRGMLPGVYLLTLTGPHSGDIAADRERMGKAWRRLTKTANAARWWSHYALTWEVTPGEDGQGHVHAHVACVSSWIPFDELHEAWRRAMPGARVLDVQAPNRARNQAGSAANYLAKYVTKGVDPSEMTGAKAGELLVAFRGKRKVTTSRHFWTRAQLRGCPKCGHSHRSVESPCSLQDIAPGAVLRSMVVRRKRLGVQEQFPPWMRRELHPPPLVVAPRPSRLNAPSRWVLP